MPEPSAPEDALRRLEEQIERASGAAERLLAEAAARVKPPPSGWQQAPDEPAAPDGGELAALIAAAQSMRDLLPPDLRQRLAEALRELLLALRTLIDWYVERLEREGGEKAEVEDIPVR